MPIYEYACRKCHRQVEVLQKMTDKPLSRCRECGGRLERLLSSVSIQFKGSGWYVTDYSRKTSGNGDGKAPKEKSETKTESKTEAKTETETTPSKA